MIRKKSSLRPVLSIPTTPVEGCEIVPTVTFPDKTVKDLFGVAYRWERSEPFLCTLPDCRKIASFLCEKNYYCSTAHYKEVVAHSEEEEEEEELRALVKEVVAHLAKPVESPSFETTWPSPVKLQWSDAAEGICYKPVAEDVGCVLRLSLELRTDSQGPVTSTVSVCSELVLPAAVPVSQRKLILISNDKPKVPLKLLTYNVLSPFCTARDRYPHCPSWALAWTYRRERVLQELFTHAPDLVCLQEVTQKAFISFFLPSLAASGGFDGIFQARARKTEGSALFFKKDRFQLLEKLQIDLGEEAKKYLGETATDTNKLKRLAHPNICLIAVLEDKEAERKFCVANPHLFWMPEFPDVKLWQSWVVVRTLERFYFAENLPVLMAGDFNSQPSSAVYEFLATGKVEQSHADFAKDFARVLPAADKIKHGLSLQSAYALIGEPEYSNFTQGFVGLLDYLWFTKAHFHVVALLDVDPKKALKEHTALPSPKHPSDHIPMMAVLDWNETA